MLSAEQHSLDRVLTEFTGGTALAVNVGNMTDLNKLAISELCSQCHAYSF